MQQTRLYNIYAITYFDLKCPLSGDQLVNVRVCLVQHNLGNAASFDELPLNTAVYTTSHVVGDVVHTVLYSGGAYLEMVMYVKIDAVISPDDGHFVWDATTSKYRNR